MTTISGYSQSSRNVVNSANQFADQKSTLDTLQTQLASGKIAYTYAGLGAGAATSLSMNARLSTLDGYGTAITSAQTRVSLAATGLQQMSTLSSTLSTDLTGNYMTDLAQRGQVQTIAKGDFAEAVDTLNSDVNGRYLFSGRATDTQPVASMDLILNGDPANGLDGVSQVVAQRITADLGSGLGGLTNTVAGTTVTVASQYPTSGNGMIIAASPAPSSSTAAITVATTTGTPPSTAINVASQPAGGDTLSLTLTLPDGTTKAVTLTAGTVAGATPGTTFAIGATTADTAANIQAALNTQLTTVATTDLPAASTMRASTDFFSGDVYPADQVVQWYKGDSGTDSPRETGSVQVSDNQTVAIGLRANEPGIRTTLAALAALAVTSYSTTDTTVVGPFNALATRTAANLVGPNGTDAINGMTTDLANASVALGKASDRVSATSAQVQNSIDSVENADPTTIAANLLAVQTRLQASYQTTAAIAKLSLTDYL